MRIFGTIFDALSIPVAIIKDVITLGNVGDTSYTLKEIQRIKFEEELREIIRGITKK